MKTEVSTLIGPALDWTAALAHGYDEGWLHRQLSNPDLATRAIPALSTDWSAGGPLIDQHVISVFSPKGVDSWVGARGTSHMHGPTPLVAAMRCLVVSRLGHEVDVPEGLLS